MNDKKQIPLRISAQLYAEILRLAEADFRSLNGEIEYILHEYAVRRKGKSETSEKIRQNESG